MKRLLSLAAMLLVCCVTLFAQQALWGLSLIHISLSHLDNDGMIVGNADTYERLTGMVNASWKIKPWLEV